MVKLFCVLVLFLVYSKIFGQDIEHDEIEKFKIDDFPVNVYGENVAALFFGANTETNSFYFYTQNANSDSYHFLGELKVDDEYFFNSAKLYEHKFVNDTIHICTEAPFRATMYCYFIPVINKTFSKALVESYDPSYDAVENAENALKRNKIDSAVYYYNMVMYPMSYINEDEVGKNLMFKAHSLALQAFKVGEFNNACNYMKNALDYYINTTYLNFESINAVIELQNEQRDNVWTVKELQLWLGDYGLFLYKAKELSESIKINAYLNKLFPDLCGPYLQHADALFDSGNVKDAKLIYKKYTNLMKAQKKSDKIPSRAIKRAK